MRDIKTLQLAKNLKGEQIEKFWALKNISMIKTDQETLFFGLYGQTKVAKYPQDFAVGDGCNISRISYCGS